MTRKDGFIEATARDYDMEYCEVERIKSVYPNEFYEKLEEYIAERSNRNK